jgi:hypothetical protein
MASLFKTWRPDAPDVKNWGCPSYRAFSIHLYVQQADEDYSVSGSGGRAIICINALG